MRRQAQNSLRLRRMAIQEHGEYHKHSACGELQRQLEAEQIHGRQTRNDDGQRRREPLQDVVGVFHHHGNDKAPSGLQHD